MDYGVARPSWPEDAESRAARLAALPRELAAEMEELMRYPAESAGQLMDTSVTVFSAEETARRPSPASAPRPPRRIHDLCVVNSDGRLIAVLPLQEVVELLEYHKLASLPVVSFEGRLRGIIRHDALVEAAQQEASENLQTMVEAGREEHALLGPVLAVRKRLPWLQVTIWPRPF